MGGAEEGSPGAWYWPDYSCPHVDSGAIAPEDKGKRLARAA